MRRTSALGELYRAYWAPLDALLRRCGRSAEDRWQAVASRAEAPKIVFDRVWANALIDHASTQIGAEYEADGRKPLFDAIFPRIRVGRGEDGLAAITERLGLSEAAVKMALSRLRRRFAGALRAEVAPTVGSRGEVQEELRYLLSGLGEGR